MTLLELTVISIPLLAIAVYASWMAIDHFRAYRTIKGRSNN